jgi:Ca-activated chloride channel family protein
VAAAALQPRWGVEEEAVRRRGVDILVCLDVSYSMLARDTAPDRLGRARLELEALLGDLGADRIGLILVAGEARRAAPLTTDHPAFLSLLRLASPRSLRQGGTDLAAALDAARLQLEAVPGVLKNVLLVSDGEDRAGRASAAAAACRDAGVVVHTLVIGSEGGGKITLTAPDGNDYFLRDDEGKEVVTRPSAEDLARIAATTGGAALRPGAEVGVLRRWYRKHVLPQARSAAVGDPALERANRYQVPLAFALVGALLGLAGFGRRHR